MDQSENKRMLNESIVYFEDLINIILPQGIEGVKATELMTHYNRLRNELAKLYVDID